MSCLYSSPEVTSVELLVLKSIALDCRRHRRLIRSGTPHARPDRRAVRFHTDFAVRRRQQDAFPNSPADAAGRISRSACQNKHRFLAWLFKRNIRLSFALRSKQRSSLKPSRSIRTCVLEPFTRGGL